MEVSTQRRVQAESFTKHLYAFDTRDQSVSLLRPPCALKASLASLVGPATPAVSFNSHSAIEPADSYWPIGIRMTLPCLVGHFASGLRMWSTYRIGG